MPLRRALVALLVAMGGSSLPAHQSSPAAQEPLPTFRAGIEAVQVDAFVTDADGNPVTDLTADDFEIIENGVPRSITTFASMNIPVEPPRGRAETWPVEPDVIANDGPEGRIYLFLLDEVTAELALRTRVFLRRFLEEHFGPNDLGAVILTGRGLVTDGQGFTNSPRRLLTAIDKFTGGFESRRRSACESQERAWASESVSPTRPRQIPLEQWTMIRNRLAGVRSAATLLAGIPGGRKTILYFAECVGHDMFEVRDYRGGVLSLQGEDAHAAMAAATRGNVSFYPIDPTGLSEDGGLESLEVRADMAALAEVTGGFALINSNSVTQAFERLVRENSTYYVLGFNSAYERRDGRFVRVDVRVRRPGLRVQSRAGYVSPLDPSPRVDPTAPPASAVAVAMANPITTRGLPMRASAAPFRGSDRDAAVALIVEVDVSKLPLVERDGVAQTTLEISYAATDTRYRAYAGAAHAVRLSRRPDESRRDSPEWMRLVSQLALPPGQYQIRVAAGAGTQAGSVLYDLDVPDFDAAPLALSGIALTAASAISIATMRPAAGESSDRLSATRCRPPSCVVPLTMNAAPSGNDPLRDALPAPPTTRREFERTDALAFYVEVYEGHRQAPPHTIEVRSALRGENGAILPLAAEERASTAERRPSGGYGFSAQVSLASVPPGRYLLHVEARSDAAGASTVSGVVPLLVR